MSDSLQNIQMLGFYIMFLWVFHMKPTVASCFVTTRSISQGLPPA